MDRRHHLVLRGFVRPEFARRLADSFSDESFRPSVHPVGAEDAAKTSAGARLMEGMLFNAEVFDFVRFVCREPRLSFVQGRVYRMRREAGHRLVWHGDRFRARRGVGFSIDLSPRSFAGGEFEMRALPAKKTTARVHNVGLGNALIFRVSDALEHRVIPVRGKNPKVAFTGWFYRRVERGRGRAGPARAPVSRRSI